MAGSYVQPTEGMIVCKLLHTRVPYFNAGIYLENKQEVGKVDDIFGPVSEAVCFQIYRGGDAEFSLPSPTPRLPHW